LTCRHCKSELDLTFLDLGSAPPSNAYIPADGMNAPEIWYPLRLLVCQRCWLVQTEDYPRERELFSPTYAYFSSYSSTWLAHCERYAAAITDRFSLSAKSLVCEVAANDGYLLQYFRRRGIPCLGIEPTKSTALAARARGIEIVEAFFGTDLANELARNGQSADLIVANNVLGHVPNINDFVRGFACLLKPEGVATFEFPHLLQMRQEKQFDTAYHEHYSYLSLTVVQQVFQSNGLELFDVEEWPTHGGSLRVFAQRLNTGLQKPTRHVEEMLTRERAAGMCDVAFYSGFQLDAEKIKNDFLSFLIASKRNQLKVCAYGAAAKGNTLINFAGIRSDLIAYVIDRNPAKVGCLLPGSRIPVVAEAHLKANKPDRIVILPWNLTLEIERDLSYVRDWGAKFITAVPHLKVFI
jgi:SAM-dependent methyltransferase